MLMSTKVVAVPGTPLALDSTPATPPSMTTVRSRLVAERGDHDLDAADCARSRLTRRVGRAVAGEVGRLSRATGSRP